MYTDKYNFKGDHPSVADELFSDVTELELRYDAVREALDEGYFTLAEALSKFGISEIEYLSLSILNNKDELLKIEKQEQLFNALSYMIRVFKSSTKSFDMPSQKAIVSIEKIIKKSSEVHVDLPEFAG